MFKTSMAISPTRADFAPLLFAGDWAAALDAAIDLGYDAIEMSVRDPADPEVVECNDEARRRGLRVSAFATGQSFYSDGWALTSDHRDVQQQLGERMRRIIDLAASWPALVVIGGVRGEFTGLERDHVDQYRRAVEAVRQLAEYALQYDVWLAVEPINRYETNFLNTISGTLQFIDDVGLGNLGILPDTFHMNIEEVSLAESLRAAGERILHTQFTDSNRLAAGQGHIDFRVLAEVLRELDYRGYLSAEILPLPDNRTAAQRAIEFFRSL
jgi:sugar phosphate isomerase/epimerase